MKTLGPLLLLSLAANLALGAVWLWRKSAPPPATTVSSTRAEREKSPAPVPAATAPAPVDPQTWSRLAAASDADFVARLRAEGFPREVVTALAATRVNDRHAAAFRKFQPSGDYAYWRREGSMFVIGEDLTPEQRAERRALQRQVGEELRELLGPEDEELTEAQRANRARFYGDLPREKIDQLGAINRDYSELMMLVRDRSQRVTLPEDRAQLAALEAEKRKDLAAVLTPAELLEYDLRSSPSANVVRNRLRYFDATEEEYRAMTTLQLAFDQAYGGNLASGEQQQRRVAAQAELTEQIRALLTPERFAEYEIKTDRAYPQIANLYAQFNRSDDPAAAVAVQRDLTGRYEALRNNRSLDAATRNTQLDALAAEARSRMETALGPEVYPVFKANGSTIHSLLNRNPPKPSGP